jgi:hypothetical protein
MMSKDVRRSRRAKLGRRGAGIGVALAVAAALVVALAPSGGTSPRHGPVTSPVAFPHSVGGGVNPWVLNDPAFASRFSAPADPDASRLVIPDEQREQLIGLLEDGASLSSRATAWTQTGTGALITQGGSQLLVASVSNSLDGDGAVVARITLNATGGTDTAVRYQANGVGTFVEQFTNGTPDANGVLPFTGTGRCTGGTGVHRHERCRYTTTGTYNPTTSVVSFTITGMTTR